MSDALLVGDIHLSEKAPISRKSSYNDEILAKLQFCVEKANELDLPIVQGGDVFHIRSASRNSHRLVQQTHEILKETRKGVWFIPGNHDLAQGNRLESLESQPLGTLSRMASMNLLVGEDASLPGIAGVPYISQFDEGGWQRTLKDLYSDFCIDSPELLVTHAPIFPPGQEPGVYYSIEPDAWCDYWMGIPATFYSHIHDNHGVFMSPNGCMQFCNHGALSRGSLHESSVNRKPAITSWIGGEFARIEVPHKAPDQVFLFDKAVAKVESKASAEQFAQAIASAQLTGLTINDIHDTLLTQVEDIEVRQLIEQLLEEAL